MSRLLLSILFLTSAFTPCLSQAQDRQESHLERKDSVSWVRDYSLPKEVAVTSDTGAVRKYYDVTVSFILETDSSKSDLKIESSDFPDFNEEAIRQVKAKKFSPNMKDGKPIRSKVIIPVRFKEVPKPSK